MAGQFEGIAEIDRPIEEVFAFLADGENDRSFSPRVQEIRKTTEGPTGVGTVYASTVKDAGMTTRREIRISAFEVPTTIRWTELSKNLVTSKDGGYDLEATPSGGTRVRIFNVLEGHGLGKVLVGLALSAARKDAPAFAARIKAALEAAIPAPESEPGATPEAAPEAAPETAPESAPAPEAAPEPKTAPEPEPKTAPESE